MKSLWSAVVVLCVVLVKTEDSDVFGYELIMGALQTMQSNIHALEQAITSVGSKVDQMMADERLSTKVDSIVVEQSKLTEKFTDGMKITASKMDDLKDGMQSQCSAMESDIKSAVTKVEQLITDQCLSKMTMKINDVKTEQSKLSEKISDHSRTSDLKMDTLMTGMQSNRQTLEYALQSVATKIDQLRVDQHLASRKMEHTMNMNVDESRCPGKTGVHLLGLPNRSSFPVYCEDGWIVIQRRSSGVPSFNRMWNEYRNGFGDVRDVHSDHWLGLEKTHQITSGGSYDLKVILENSYGIERTAKYTGFEIGSEKEQYRLYFRDFSSGDAGDSLTEHKGMKFSTPDRDNDKDYFKNCAERYSSGWWFKDCYESNLNGPRESSVSGIVWKHFERYRGLDKSRMMIRQMI